MLEILHDKTVIVSLLGGALAALITGIITSFSASKRLNLDKWTNESKEARELRQELKDLLKDARDERDKAVAERDKARLDCNDLENEADRLRGLLVKAGIDYTK